MATRKRNEFLDDGNDSNEEDQLDVGYDSDASQHRRGGLSSKRRRIDIDDNSDVESTYHTADEDAAAAEALAHQTRNESDKDEEAEVIGFEGDEAVEEEQDQEEDGPERSSLSSSASALRKAAKAQAAARKTGVIYISRVPPFMKPHTLQHLLTPHAPRAGLGRVFLTPEDASAHSRRVKSGGNKKKSFTDGWVEFGSKKEAKIAAEVLNGNIIGGKKGGFYYDDLWNVKYLKGFKWSHLTEQIANENAERAARLREEVRRTRKENKAFKEDVERGRVVEGMERKRKAQGREGLEEREGLAGTGRRKMDFKQTKARKGEEVGAGKPSKDLNRVLGKIF